jgi:flagellar protein FliL
MSVFRICTVNSVSARVHFRNLSVTGAKRFVPRHLARKSTGVPGYHDKSSALELHFFRAMSVEDTRSATTAADTKKPKAPAAMMIGVALAAIAGGGASAWFVMQRNHGVETSHGSGGSIAPQYLIHLEGFTVNLADPEETHFLRATIDLGIDRLPEGVDREKPAAQLPVPRIRDAILSVLTTCKADNLLTPEGKAQLKKQLVDALNRSVPEIGVRDVYFTEFLVQR